MKPRVYISGITYGPPYWQHVLSLFMDKGVIVTSYRAGIQCRYFQLSGDSALWRARCVEMSTFLTQTDCTHFFSVDQDVAYPPDVLIRLIENDKPIVSGIYRSKTDERFKVTIRMLGDTPEECSAAERRAMLKPDLLEVQAVSCGCTLVKREVVEDMAYKCEKDDLHFDFRREGERNSHMAWAFYHPLFHVWPWGEREYCGEDWSFSLRAHKYGYSTWADFRVQCDHYGTKRYGFDNLPEKFLAKGGTDAEKKE